MCVVRTACMLLVLALRVSFCEGRFGEYRTMISILMVSTLASSVRARHTVRTCMRQRQRRHRPSSSVDSCANQTHRVRVTHGGLVRRPVKRASACMHVHLILTISVANRSTLRPPLGSQRMIFSPNTACNTATVSTRGSHLSYMAHHNSDNCVHPWHPSVTPDPPTLRP